MRKKRIGRYTQNILDNAKKFGIQSKILPGPLWMIELSYRGHREIMHHSSTRLVSETIARVTKDKAWTQLWLKEFGFPVAPFVAVESKAEARKHLSKLKPLVVKPVSADRGEGITLNVVTQKELDAAMTKAQQYSESVILEKMQKGFDVRLLIIGKHVFGIRRHRASVTGDGIHTVDQLRMKYNRRRVKHAFPIAVSPELRRVLRQQKLTLRTKPSKGQCVYLSETPNVHSGGISEDVTDQLKPFHKKMAKQIADAFTSPVLGIDWYTEDMRSTKGVVLEINRLPGLLMHEYPHIGTPQPVTAHLLALLFPNNPTLRSYR